MISQEPEVEDDTKSVAHVGDERSLALDDASSNSTTAIDQSVARDSDESQKEEDADDNKSNEEKVLHELSKEE